MENFFICLNAVIPLFLMMATGYGAKRAGFIREEEVSRFNAVSFKVFMPVMCFYSVYSSDLSASLRPRVLLFAGGGVILLFFIGFLFTEKCVPDPKRRGVVAMGFFRSNYLIIGVSFAVSLSGSEAAGIAAMVGAVVVPLFNALSVVILELNAGKRSDWRALALDVLKNPLVLGTLTGIAFLALGLHLPLPVESAVRDMARVGSPLLLFLLGAFFKTRGFEGRMRELILTCLIRLVLVPAAALSLAAALGFRNAEFSVLIAVFASSAAANSFTMAQQMGGDPELAGNVVVVTSALCSFTLFAWSLLAKELGLC